MGKKYTTDEIEIGGHMLDASMMGSLNTVVTDSANYMTTLPSHNHDYVSEGGTSFSGVYPMVVRVSADSIYSHPNVTFTGSTSQLYVGGSVRTPTLYDSNNTNYYVNPASTSNLNGLNAVNVTLTGDLQVDGQITQAGVVDRVSWGRTYSASNTTIATLVTKDGGALPTGGAYRMTGHISGTGTDQVSMAVFWNEDGTWYCNNTFAGGTSSNHIEFLISDSVPKVKTWHSTNYSIHVAHERLSLDETGTDNLRGYFGSDSFLKWTESTNSLVVPGTISATSGNSTEWNTAYTHSQSNHAPSNAEANIYSTPTELLTAIKTVDGSGSGLDADKLDGIQGASFLRSDSHDTFTGKLSVGSTSTRRAGMYGIYDSNKIGHIWSMGTGFTIDDNGATFGNLYGAAYKHTNNTTGGTMGGGHQFVWTDNGVPRGSIGYNSVWHAESMKAPIFYDSNNTGYYANPDSTSRLNVLNVNKIHAIGVNSNTAPRWDTSFHVVQSQHWYGHNNSQTMYLGESSNPVRLRGSLRIGSDANADSGMALTVNGSANATTSFRAPIFYDSNDTNYYLNPASTSNLNELLVNGNTVLGSSNGNTTRVNDTLYVEATDSGDSHFYFGENSSGGYGTYWNWDSGYRHTWYSRNAGTNTSIMYHNTNDTSYLYFTRAISMSNKDINHVNQLHFQDNVRFYDDGNDSYLNFKYGDATTGGIRLRDGAGSQKGVLFANESGFGLLDNDGSWAVRTQTGTNPLELRCDNNAEFLVYNSYTLSPGSSRAPTFYDSNNTSYYVNAASTSNFLGLKVGYNDLLLQDTANTYSAELKMQNNTHTIGIDYQNNETLRFITRSGTTTVPITFQMRAGTITAANFILSSDERKKTKIVDLSCDNIDVSWKSFEMKDNEGEYRTGVIAQELEQKHPEFVNTNDEGFKSVKYIDLLIAKIAELEARLEKLEK